MHRKKKRKKKGIKLPSEASLFNACAYRKEKKEIKRLSISRSLQW